MIFIQVKLAHLVHSGMLLSRLTWFVMKDSVPWMSLSLWMSSYLSPWMFSYLSAPASSAAMTPPLPRTY